MGSCFRCGRRGHYASQCYASTTKRGFEIESSDSENEELQCDRCFRIGHSTDTCFAKTTSSGEPLERSKRPKHSDQNKGIYVLENESGYFYVGKSNDISNRVEQHKTGNGALFVDTMGKFKRINPITSGSGDDMESWERNETLHRMWTHGIDQVCGWMFTTQYLSDEQKSDAFKQICEKFDLCRKCGRSSHFASECFAKSKDSWASS